MIPPICILAMLEEKKLLFINLIMKYSHQYPASHISFLRLSIRSGWIKVVVYFAITLCLRFISTPAITLQYYITI